MLRPRASLPVLGVEPEGHDRGAQRDVRQQGPNPRPRLDAGEYAMPVLIHFLQEQLDRGKPDGEPELPERESPGRRLPQVLVL